VRQGTSVQTGFPFTGKKQFSVAPYLIFPPVSEYHRVNPFTATQTVPIDRSDLEDFLRNHEPTAAMTPVDSTVLFPGHNLGHTIPSLSIGAPSAEKDSAAELAHIPLRLCGHCLLLKEATAPSVPLSRNATDRFLIFTGLKFNRDLTHCIF
jgi:hypothetical protein